MSDHRSSENPPRTRVVVVGGGIGGMATALMLGRAGVSVTVLEQAPEFGEVGAGIQLAPNITRMLDEVGVLEHILPLAVVPNRLVFRNAVSGAELTHLDLADARARYGGPYIVLHRSDLHFALVDAARALDTVALHTSAAVDHVEHDEHGATAVTTDGRRFTGDVLVGADGVRSVVRGLLSDDEPVPSGYVAYRGAVPLDDAPAHLALDDVNVWLGPGCHLVQYPVRAGELYNQVAVFRSQEYLDGKEDWGTPEELDATYADLAEPVSGAIPSLGRVNRWPMSDREPLRRWTTGRVTLLGDAAHAMLQYLAQGAGQSLLDGASLTRHLAAIEGEWTGDAVAAALAAYESDRVAAAGATQTVGRVWGDIWHVEDPVAVLLRDHAFSNREITDYSLVDWLYGPVVGEDDVPPPPLPAAYPDSDTAPTGA
ncbi:FAD-dependent monooxygenase [Georgenia sp. Z1491]|uniref:FAD-dependent monooxygenase n=1 Tax=Georgenia sp. Z1491 TaxID=3416707 RepID=UPI003CF45CD3